MKGIIKGIVALCLFSQCMFGQEDALKKADSHYSRYGYVEAIRIYERVAEKGYVSADLYKKLGNAYYYNANMEAAHKWYAKLFALEDADIEPEYHFRYAQVLKSTGDSTKAKEYLKSFAAASGTTYTLEPSTDTLQLDVITYQIENAVMLNSDAVDFGTSFYKDGVVFASSRSGGKIHKWTGKPFLDFFAQDTKEQEVYSFSDVLNSKYNESSAVFTKDGTTMYFTRNNYDGRKTGKDKNKIIRLKIYRSVMQDGTWGKVKELPFNSDLYSVAHPALSSDEKTLYFSSDMPGGQGLSDLYKVSIHEDGSFGTPENLGDTINTMGRESFPFIDADNQLYFASDGHVGYGGLDIFVTDLDKQQVHNLGKSVNSIKDDFAFIIDSNKEGYFSSNREGGRGDDDIYSFKQLIKTVCSQEVEGLITDKDTGLSIQGATLTLLEVRANKEITRVTSNADGYYTFSLDCASQYFIRVEKDGYVTQEELLASTNEKGFVHDKPFALEKKQKELAVGTDLFKTLNLNIIYFDLNKSYIRADAVIELEKIVAVMEEYPNLKIAVRSHTDSRASYGYNKALSDRRAKSTVAYLVKQGIAKDRLTGQGYGERELVNNCSDGVPCSESEHQQNRRSEFIIVE